MFFTLKSVSCFILDADGFDPAALQSLVGLLSSTAATVLFTNLQITDIQRTLNTSRVTAIAGQAFIGNFFREAVRSALSANSLLPCQSVFISTSIQRIQMAQEFLMGTILFQTDFSPQYTASIYRSFPDFCVSSHSELEAIINGKNVGWHAEQACRTTSCTQLFPHATDRFSRIAIIPNEEILDCPIYTAGRYFGSKDPRFSLNPLSHKILLSKEHPERLQNQFASIFIQTIKIAVLSMQQHFIVACIPPRPKEKNRTEIFLNAMPSDKSWSEIASYVSINPNLITCIRDYPKLKGLNFSDRRKEVRDAFILNRAQNVAGKNIIITDDVLTTSASMNEAIRLLKASGATKIVPLTIGYHPLNELHVSLPPDPLCTKCNASMTCKRNKNDATLFYGCSNYAPGGEKHPTLKFGTAVQKRISALQSELMKMPEWWELM